MPATGFLAATIANPAEALTDFTLLFDLADAPAAWWSAVDTADGTRGRAYRDSDGARLAVDWIDFDNLAETGLVRIKWTGTLAASGTQKVWIYPPHSANPPVAASDANGSDNAYASHWQQYMPSGGVTDRTANGNDMTGAGGIGDGDSTFSKLTSGLATAYDGGGEHYTTAVLETDADSTIMCWVKPDIAASAAFAWDQVSGSGSGAQGRITGAAAARIDLDDGTSNVVSSSAAAFSDATWTHFVQRVDITNTNQDLWVDGSETDSDSIAALGDTSASAASLKFGEDTAGSFPIAGDIAEIQLHTAALSDAWIATEFSQTNDNASFWSGVAWNGDASDLLDPAILKPSLVDGGGNLKSSLLTASGELKPSLLNGTGALKASLIDEAGNLRQSWLAD